MYSEMLITFIMLGLLGVFHGINPGMGWLFAVGLGLQEERRAAVWSALLPLALGHALAIGVTLILVGIIGLVIPVSVLKWCIASILVGFGVYRLFRNRHPRYGGMQVNFRQLSVWSFLMASAHGAGLMVVPFLFKTINPVHHAPEMQMQGVSKTGEMADHAAGHADHAGALLASLPAEPLIGLMVILVHTLGYLLIMGMVAVLVYEKLGLRLLRTTWFNIDLLWAFALILSGIIIPLI